MAAQTDLHTHRKLKFIVFKLVNNQSEAVVEKKGDNDSTYEEFLSALPELESRWAVYRFEVEGDAEHKIAFITWYVIFIV